MIARALTHVSHWAYEPVHSFTLLRLLCLWSLRHGSVILLLIYCIDGVWYEGVTICMLLICVYEDISTAFMFQLYTSTKGHLIHVSASEPVTSM